MIRCAREMDVPAIAAMVGRYRDEVRPDLALHPLVVEEAVARMVSHPRGFALLLEDIVPQGVLLASAAPAVWWPELIAQMQLFWIAPVARGKGAAPRMLARFESWAAEIGAAKAGATWTGKDASAFYARQGYRMGDMQMLKDLR